MLLLFRVWLVVGLGTLPLGAAFVAPAEGPVPFRRDKLPLDVDTMAALSRQVTVFAASAPVGAAEERRAVAQMTALALALDPANRAARELIKTMEEGGAGESDAVELERARNRAWQVLAWLEMPEAGADGQALAACLGDVLMVADPRHPKARELQAAGEKGAWKAWVADESAFRTQEKEPEPMPEPGEDPMVETPTLALEEVSSMMPFWASEKQPNGMGLTVAAVTLRAAVGKEPGVSFELAGDADGKEQQRLAKVLKPVERAIRKRHPSMPAGLQLRLDFGKSPYALSSNGPALTGTAALLLESVMTGKPPAAIAMAVVGDDGKLELPPKFWQALREYAEFSETFPETPKRLILPEAAASYLTALVAMENAEFFMNHEVLLAGTVDELCDLAAAEPKAEIADGLKRFEDIQKVGKGKTLGSFVAHPATQQRLRDLATAMPVHASARMLALQGSGSRPRFVERSILAREIRAALGPVSYLSQKPYDELDAGLLDSAHEKSRAELDKLTKYIDIRDRDLHKSAEDVADSLRALARLLPKEDIYSTTLIQKQRAAYRDAKLEYFRVIGVLTQAAGDEEDFPLPKAAPDP